MSTNILSCQACGTALDPMALGQPQARCGGCDTRYRLHVFRAAFRDDRNGQPPKPVGDSGQATCYHHAAYQAEQVCDHCGRYLCSLCDITSVGGHLCPVCLRAMAQDEENHRFRTTYPRYDRLVLGLAVLPILLTIFTIITAPIALGLGIYGWNRAYNPVRAYRGTLLIGMAIAALEIGFWVLAIGGAIFSGLQ